MSASPNRESSREELLQKHTTNLDAEGVARARYRTFYEEDDVFLLAKRSAGHQGSFPVREDGTMTSLPPSPHEMLGFPNQHSFHYAVSLDETGTLDVSVGLSGYNTQGLDIVANAVDVRYAARDWYGKLRASSAEPVTRAVLENKLAELYPKFGSVRYLDTLAIGHQKLIKLSTALSKAISAFTAVREAGWYAFVEYVREAADREEQHRQQSANQTLDTPARSQPKPQPQLVEVDGAEVNSDDVSTLTAQARKEVAASLEVLKETRAQMTALKKRAAELESQLKAQERTLAYQQAEADTWKSLSFKLEGEINALRKHLFNAESDPPPASKL